MASQFAIDHLRAIQLKMKEPGRLQVQFGLDLFVGNGEE
jgi:hypothetical protein